MYNAQKTADIIKKMLIDKNITGKNMCQQCNLGINTLSNIRRGDVKSIETFYVIADYLECSVDYLLGRTDIPDMAVYEHVYPQFPGRLRYLRTKKNLSIYDMATLFDLTERNYAGLEIGEVMPPLVLLASIADYFDVSIDYLIGRTDTPEIA